MELANRSRIALSGCKRNDLQVQRVTINHLGFNSRYQLIIEGACEQFMSRSFFEDTVSIKHYQNTGINCFHGELLTLTQQYIKANAWTWQLEIGCSLHRLDNVSGHHVFVDKTVQEIIEALFNESAISCQFNIKGPMTKLPYTAQGGVSDYDFFMRLCVEHGLVFFYRHQPSGAQLYLSDEPQVFHSHPLKYNPANGLIDAQAVITRMTGSQVSLPENVRLRAYPEEDISAVWETITNNQTAIPGTGIVNLTLTQSLQSQKDCDQRAHLLQQQLDWQRETFYIETSNSQLQPADCVEITEKGQSKPYLVFDVCSSVDEAPEEGEPHPFKQKAYLLALNSVYKPPCQATRLYDLDENEAYIPQGWMASFQKPLPALQMAVIAGDKDNQVQIDAQGRYMVKPLFDQNTASSARGHYVRQVQPGAGLPKDKPQGMHLPLTPNTRVILGHLDDQIDKPFILGVYPDREQIAAVNHYNHEMLSLKHRNGCGLEFSEISQITQSIHLFTEENEHGIKLQSKPEEENIHAKSKKNMHIQSQKDSHLKSKQASVRTSHFHFEAEEDFSIATQESMDIESGGNVSFTNGQDWQCLVQSGKLSSESVEKLTLEGKNIVLYAPHIHGKTAKTLFHAGHALNFTAAKSLGLEAGASQAVFSDKSIGFKAQKISINAGSIKLHQGGMANSGAAIMPEIKKTPVKETKASKPVKAQPENKQPKPTIKTPKNLSQERLQDKEGYLLSEADKATILEAQKKIEALKLTRIDDGKNSNLVHIAVIFDGTWNNRVKIEDTTNPGWLYLLFDEDKVIRVYKKGVGTDPETKWVGGAVGLGAFARVVSAFKVLTKLINKIKKANSNKEIILSVVGFSRGATEARHFVNEVVKYGIPDLSSNVNGSYTRSVGTPRIGALVLFDTVASLGIPGTAVTMGFKMSIPSQVENVLHITANDEHRAFFPLHSVIDNSKPEDPRILEIGLPGVHADIGGGYPNSYSRIALNLAYNYLKKLNVPLKNIGCNKTPSLDDPSLRLHDSRYLTDKLWQDGKRIIGITDHRHIYHVHNQ